MSQHLYAPTPPSTTPGPAPTPPLDMHVLTCIVHRPMHTPSCSADVQEFYVGTLDASLPESQKALKTEQLASQWERHSPIPIQDKEVSRANEIHSNENATERSRTQEYVAVSVHSSGLVHNHQQGRKFIHLPTYLFGKKSAFCFELRAKVFGL